MSSRDKITPTDQGPTNNPAKLTLARIAENPDLLTSKFTLRLGEAVCLRPLAPDDVDDLTHFLESFSEATREFFTYPSYDFAQAKELCDAINRYDKLRIVLRTEANGKIIALFEFSFDIPEGDQRRFASYNIQVDSTFCRIAPCIADEYQSKGVGSMTLPYLVDIAKRFGQKHIILWGGVLEEQIKMIEERADAEE